MPAVAASRSAQASSATRKLAAIAPGRVVGDAVLGLHAGRAHARALAASACAMPSARSRRAVHGRARAAQHARVAAGRRRTSAGAARSPRGRRAPRARWRRSSGRAAGRRARSPRPRRDLAVGHAQQHDLGAGRDRLAAPQRRARPRAPRPAPCRDAPRRRWRRQAVPGGSSGPVLASRYRLSHMLVPHDAGNPPDSAVPGGILAPCPAQRSGARSSRPSGSRPRRCTRCPQLAAARTTVVFGSGNADADLMFVGEAPGANEDKQGLPFVGQAGRLLDTLLGEIGLTRGDVFVCNMLKCRPPGNRDPLPQEIDACQDYLFRQLELIEPKVVCTLGNFATKLLRADPTGHHAAARARGAAAASGRATCGCTRSSTPRRRSTRRRCWPRCGPTSRGSRSCWRCRRPSSPQPEPEPEPEPEPVVPEPGARCSSRAGRGRAARPVLGRFRGRPWPPRARRR